ncbi:16S rRNA (cytosine(967)-C(5))-methyltransferase RsmB [candidate division KSB1 bacterium]
MCSGVAKIKRNAGHIKTNPRLSALDLLQRLEVEGLFLSREVDRIQRGLTERRDRALFLELVNGVLRLRLRLDAELKPLIDRQFAELSPLVVNVLRLGLYQLRFLDRVPAYAVVNESVAAVRALGQPGAAGLVNAVLRRAAAGEVFTPPEFERDPVEHLSVNWSHPSWLVERWLKRWGAKTVRRLLEADNRRPGVTVRVNRLRTDAEDLARRFQEAGLEIQKGRLSDQFLRLRPEGAVESLPGYDLGHFQVQDEGAGMVARIIDPKPGEVVVDLCAAPGGKAGFTAELMGDNGLVIALDVNRSRLGYVRRNAARLGIGAIKPVLADGRRLPVMAADRVLVDVPCTGTGTLARRPDLRWRKGLEDIDRLVRLQSELLESGAGLLSPGGILVYATCSLETEENEGVVEDFLIRHPEFKLELNENILPAGSVRGGKYFFVTPHEHEVDGAFAARMTKVV